MGLLLRAGGPSGDNGEEGLESFNREPARRRCCRGPTQACSSQWNDAFNPGVEPHNTDAPEARLGRNPEEREDEAIQRVRWISHLYRIGWRCDELERGILM